MAPKKNVVEAKPLLGRPSNNLKIGVVGLPNVGKSTFFNALTNASAAAENYPFCTIGKVLCMSLTQNETDNDSLQTPKNPVSLSPMLDLTGCANTTNPPKRSLLL